MEAGKLKHRITVQRPEKTRSATGQMMPGWADVCTVWAEIQCTDSKAVDGEGAIQHEGLYRIYIRYRPGITAEMRVLYHDPDTDADRIFLLIGPPVNWSGEKTGLTLLTKELV